MPAFATSTALSNVLSCFACFRGVVERQETPHNTTPTREQSLQSNFEVKSTLYASSTGASVQRRSLRPLATNTSVPALHIANANVSTVANQNPYPSAGHIAFEGSASGRRDMERENLSETVLFMESMLSDMEARARAVTTLDTVALGEHALLSTQALAPNFVQGDIDSAAGDPFSADGPLPCADRASSFLLHQLLGDQAYALPGSQAPGSTETRPQSSSNEPRRLAQTCQPRFQAGTCSPGPWGQSAEGTVPRPAAGAPVAGAGRRERVAPAATGCRPDEYNSCIAARGASGTVGSSASKAPSSDPPGGNSAAAPVTTSGPEGDCGGEGEGDRPTDPRVAQEAPDGAGGDGRGPGPVLMPSLLCLLADVAEVTFLPMPPRAARSLTVQGTWRGLCVAVKLVFYVAPEPARAALRAALVVARIHHPNLMPVMEVRGATADAASLCVLDPPPCLSNGGHRPAGRLRRFVQLHAPEAAKDLAQSPPSLTLYPGDLTHKEAYPLPAHRALMALRPQPGGVALAVVSELADMGNLQTLSLSPDSPFRPTRTWAPRVAKRALLRTAREVAAAVRVLHAAGIAHGSLHPANVLLCRSDVDRRGFVARVSHAGSGTLVYGAGHAAAMRPAILMLAPEALADGAAASRPAADVYTYGMLLYMMAAGNMPFEGQHLVPVLVAVESEGLRPEWPAGAHDHLEPLFRRCVAQNPADRPGFKQILTELCALEEKIKGN